MDRSKKPKGTRYTHPDPPISRSAYLPFFRSSPFPRSSPISAIFFDAAGTLFETSRSVGAIYADVLGDYGIQRSPDELEKGFKELFPQQPPLAFDANLNETNRLELEMNWWRTLVAEVVAPVENFPKFEQFFSDLFQFFREQSAWRVFDDTRPALDMLRLSGYQLGIISNFDSRLDSILQKLDLLGYFDTIQISSRVGYAKPDQRIFLAAADALNVDPRHCLHIGDSLRVDFEGALSAGMVASWLKRRSQ